MDDLISTWANADMDPLTMMHETGLFIAGGAETTRTVIGRGLAVLAEHPDQWDAAAADPDLVPGLVEEVIRWVTPLNNMFRQVLTDDHIGDQPVRAGDRVMLAYPSANRDDAVFDDPFRFDIRRDPNPHLAFGQGTHFCVGRQPGPARAAAAVRPPDPALAEPDGPHAPRPRAEHLRHRGAPVRPRLRAALTVADAPARGVQEVGDGLLAYLQPDGGWGFSNAGLVTDGDASLLVDTLFDLALTAQMLDELRAASPAAARIGTVVNTHANGDHCYGNQLVAGAEIVASDGQRPGDGRGAAGRAGRAAWRRPTGSARPAPSCSRSSAASPSRASSRCRPPPPSTASSSCGWATAPCGCSSSDRPTPRATWWSTCPTPGSSSPATSCSTARHPIVWAGPVARWIEACDAMLALDPAVVVPGHGPLGDRGVPRDQRDYFEWVVAEGTPRLERGHVPARRRS